MTNACVTAAVVISRKIATCSFTPTNLGKNNLCLGGTGSQLQVCVVARVPRKRHGADDLVQYTLQCYLFIDDGTKFTNLDVLLTRLTPLGSVYVGCTESSEGNNSKIGNSEQARKKAKINKFLDRACGVIESRGNNVSICSPEENSSGCTVAIKHLALGQSIQKEESAVEIADSIMAHLLTSGTNDGSSSSQSAAALGYRGNRILSEVPQTKQTLAFLLRELGVASSSALEDGPGGQYVFEMGRLTSHLQMDRVASEAINLLPSNGTMQQRNATNNGPSISSSSNKNSSETSSIYGILNQCHTRMGSRLLESWLRQPLVDRDQIVRRHDVVEFLVERSAELNNLRESGLKAVTDLDVLASRLSKYEEANASNISFSSSSCAALETLYRMYLFADQQLPLLLRSLADMVDEKHSEQQYRAMDVCRLYRTELESVEGALQKAKGLTETVLDLTRVPRDFLVKSNFDEELQSLRTELDGIENQLKELHQSVDDEWSQVNNCGSGQVRLERTDNSGGTAACAWQFRLPNTNDEKVLREKLSDTVQIHRVLKNGVYFSTHELRDLGASKQDVLVEYKRRQGSIVDQAMKVAGTFCPVLEQASLVIGEIDVLSSFAHVAAYQCGAGGYCRPVMTDDDSGGAGIQLAKARHPCVELRCGASDFIPNDFQLNHGSSSFQLVTGPNMGGKSTYIRSLGAVIAMAQIGSFVPCESAKINIVDCILARVGAGDAQQRGISTFMAEMLEASSILQSATKRSLIIIDELGRGTSTFDGYGIAWAISEYIIKHIQCIAVFATHFHELTRLEKQHECVKNCHVTAVKSPGSHGLTFFYEVRPGPCLESFGIQVAEMANVPPEVIENAKRKAIQLENFNYSSSTSKKSKSLKAGEQQEQLLRDLSSIPLSTMHRPEEKLEALRLVLGSGK